MKTFWNGIKTDSPKAFELLCKQTNQIDKICDVCAILEQCYSKKAYELRDLYDFFDSHSIYIWVEYTNGSWYYNIEGKDKVVIKSVPINSRINCELCMYKNAFNILEEGLQCV